MQISAVNLQPISSFDYIWPKLPRSQSPWEYYSSDLFALLWEAEILTISINLPINIFLSNAYIFWKLFWLIDINDYLKENSNYFIQLRNIVKL